MEKRKSWHLALILAVIILVIYNILPTLLYYTKPLRAPIDQPRAEEVAQGVMARVNQLDEEAVQWVKAYAKNLGIKPRSLELASDNSGLITVTFHTEADQSRFQRYLGRAGALIPFFPSQVFLGAQDKTQKTVLLQRQTPFHFNATRPLTEYFQFAFKTEEGFVTPLYKEIVLDRVAAVALALAGESQPAHMLALAAANATNDAGVNILLPLARKIVDFATLVGPEQPLTRRYFASFALSANGSNVSDDLIKTLEASQKFLGSKVAKIEEEQRRLKQNDQLLESSKIQQLQLLRSQTELFAKATSLIKQNSELFRANSKPLDRNLLHTALDGSDQKLARNELRTLSLTNRNAFIDSIQIDWANSKLFLQLFPEAAAALNSDPKNEREALAKELISRALFDEIAEVSRSAHETILPQVGGFAVELDSLTGSQSFLTLNLRQVAQDLAEQLRLQLAQEWQPTSPDFASAAYPVIDYSSFKKLPLSDQKFALVIYAPIADAQAIPTGFRANSLYVIARGAGKMARKMREAGQSEAAQAFMTDLQALSQLMMHRGALSYPGDSFGIAAQFKDDYIFEIQNYADGLLQASRENFSIHGTQQYAVLEFTDVEQRLLTLNKIETLQHEDLLKWQDEYHAAQVSMDAQSKYYVPKPTSSPLWSNFKLNIAKYFRGDDRKILKWGMDLSGGKTILIGLWNKNGQPVTNKEDLTQAVNELTRRVNKLGVSEVGIRVEGANVVLDFPGSQGLSAAELIKASSMTFHIVNEKFGPQNKLLAAATNEFLQGVWNEAVVTNRKDIESIQAIARQHLGGQLEEATHAARSAEAQLLLDNGLRLAGSEAPGVSSTFDETFSEIAMFRGDDLSEWQGQTHPLMLVYRNYALEGSDLEHVQAEYSPSDGNFLSFAVKSAYTNKEGDKIDPRGAFYMWTSQYSQENIVGTPKETLSGGHGWRMAVILNGSIVTAPSLSSPLRDHARITGSFSQRQVNQLVADLKAGSLSFTPHILSEQNISPELGLEERLHGISAAILAIVLVAAVMIAYYRFAGVVASVAVIFNLLILWGVLQNLDAALTLPGIAGIILTMGMAVDANVLIFERIREEFAISQRIGSAIQAGYRKAFSAILDSNITTIMAALILMYFGTGLIKGLAVTLIVGIASSMFTALFMTRFFFAGWVQNPEHKTLSMARLFQATSINFLRRAKTAGGISLIILLIGLAIIGLQRHTIFGMDFTGGDAVTIELEPQTEINYRLATAKALESAGASATDFQIRTLNSPNRLRIQFGTSMQQAGHPFFELPAANEGAVVYAYEHNPRLTWLVQTLNQHHLALKPASLNNLHLQWVEVSGQFSDTMRNDALLALGIALFAILVYITFRFEFKYALSAVVALAYDVLITLAFVGIFYKIGLPIQIDLSTIAALLTIIGYALNDVIIVFDRIREDLRLHRKLDFAGIINHALNATLSRTIMTSGTTLVVLLALDALGGPTILSFSLVMTVGVVVGTFATFFIAAPCLLWLHQREQQKAASLTQPHTT